VILHDVLFAPFFAGAAGCGQVWHWDFYVDRHDLWWHFGRFARAIEGFDPIQEHVTPQYWETPRLRVYALRGETTGLLWLRDKESCWKSELLADRSATPVKNERLKLMAGLGRNACVEFYDPWSNVRCAGWSEGDEIPLPDFSRSLIVRIRSADSPAA
jgi:hypothetical protein